MHPDDVRSRSVHAARAVAHELASVMIVTTTVDVRLRVTPGAWGRVAIRVKREIAAAIRSFQTRAAVT